MGAFYLDIVRAKSEDADELTRLAMSAKQYWGYPDQWIERWSPSLTLTPKYIASNEVYKAVSEGKTLGFSALVGAGTSLLLDHLWVQPDRIQTGIGRKLFCHAIERARQRGAARVEIEAEPHAEGFYLRMGARRVGEYIYDFEGQTRVLPKMVYELTPRPE